MEYHTIHIKLNPLHERYCTLQLEHCTIISKMDAQQESKTSSSERSEADILAITISYPTSPGRVVQETRPLSRSSDPLTIHEKAPTSSRNSATHAEIVSGQSKTTGREAHSQRGPRMAGCNRGPIEAKVAAWTSEQTKAFWTRTTGSEDCKYIV